MQDPGFDPWTPQKERDLTCFSVFVFLIINPKLKINVS